MKNPYWLVFLTLACLFPWLSYGQPTIGEAEKTLHAGLTIYLQGVEAYRECLRSTCKHDFSGELKIMRTGKSRKEVEYWYEDRFTYYGLARVVQRCYYEAPEATVRFYAELSYEAGVPKLTLLRWKQGECMSYETLYDAATAPAAPALLPE